MKRVRGFVNAKELPVIRVGPKPDESKNPFNILARGIEEFIKNIQDNKYVAAAKSSRVQMEKMEREIDHYWDSQTARNIMMREEEVHKLTYFNQETCEAKIVRLMPDGGLKRCEPVVITIKTMTRKLVGMLTNFANEMIEKGKGVVTAHFIKRAVLRGQARQET